MATVHPLPPIHVFIDHTPTIEERSKAYFNELYDKTCRMCDRHRAIIIGFVLCLCVGSVAISVIVKSKNTIVNPCFTYTSDTLASDVTVECIQYLWNSYQCSTALQSSPTWRWWLQSPQGKTMVKCDATHQGLMCGAGSYGTISIYLQLCNPTFGQ
jgi:hypothetical protein